MIWDCALAYPEHDQGPIPIIGGGSGRLGWSSSHKVYFVCVPSPTYERPSIRIKIGFPIAADTPATHHSRNGRPGTTHYIEFVLYAGTFTSSAEVVSETMLARLPKRTETDGRPLALLRFKLKEGCTTPVRGVGTPFKPRDAEDYEALNFGKRLEGVRSLAEIHSQTEFTVLAYSGELLQKAQAGFKKDFGEEGEWFTGFPYSRG